VSEGRQEAKTMSNRYRNMRDNQGRPFGGPQGDMDRDYRGNFGGSPGFDRQAEFGDRHAEFSQGYGGQGYGRQSHGQSYERGMYGQGMQGHGPERDWQGHDWQGGDDDRGHRGMRGEWPDYSTAGRGGWEGYGQGSRGIYEGMGYGGRSFDNDERDYRDEGLGPRIVEGAKSMFRGLKGYKRSDERIREDVCDRINQMSRRGGVDASNIEVTVREGEVTLTGTLDDRRYKHMMENIADRVDGVRDVHNQIRIQSASDRDASDRNAGDRYAGDTSDTTGNRSSLGRTEKANNDRPSTVGATRHS
jgi:hypothetical protein